MPLRAKHIVKSIGACIVALAATLAGWVALLLVVVQTPPGKSALSALLASQLSRRTGWQVEIEGLGGWLPFQVSVDRIELADTAGPWLEASHVNAALTAAPLLHGRVDIPYLRAESVQIDHRPQMKEKKEDKPFALPRVPRLPRWIALRSLETQILLDEPVAGVQAALSASGSYGPTLDEALSVNLEVIRQDAPTTTLQFALLQGEETLEVELHLDDSSVLPGLLGIAGPIRAVVSGGGDLHDWQGSYEATVADHRLVSGHVYLQGATNINVRAAAHADLRHDVLPSFLAAQWGDEADLAFEATWRPDGGVLHVASSSLKTPLASIAGSGAITLPAEQLDLAITAQHADIGRVVQQLQRGSMPVPVTAHATVHGPRDALEVAVRGESEGRELLESRLRVAVVDSIAAGGHVTLAPHAAVVPPQYAPWLDDGADVQFDIEYSREGRLAVHALEVTAAAARVAAQGTVGVSASEVDIEATVVIPDLTAVGLALGLPPSRSRAGDATTEFTTNAPRLTGTLSATLTASGAGDGIDVVGNVLSQEIQYGRYSAGKVALDLNGRLGAWPPKGVADSALRVQGALERLRLASGLYTDASLLLDASMRGEEAIDIETLQIADGNLNLAAQGTVWPKESRAELDGHLAIASLSAYNELIGRELGGAVVADVRSETGSGGQELIELDGAWEAPSGLPDPLPALMGPKTTILATAQLQNGRATVRDLKIASLHAGITGEGAFDLEERLLDASLTWSLSELELVGKALGQPLSGVADGSLEVHGPLDNLAASVEANGTNLTLPQLTSRQITLEATVTGLPRNPRGTLDATAAVLDETIQLSTDFEVAWPRIGLPKLALVSEHNSVSGSLALDTAARTGEGSLAVSLQDLSTLGALTNEPLAGSITGTLSLDSDTSALRARGELSAEDLRVMGVAAASAQADITVSFPSEGIALDASVDATELAAGPLVLHSVAVAATGDSETTGLNVHGEGVYADDLPIVTRLTGDLHLNDKHARVSVFDGKLEDLDYRLAQPFSVSWGNDQVEITPAEIAIADGSIAIEGSVSDKATLETRVRDLPLALAEYFGGPALRGQADGRLLLTGAASRPEAEVELTLSGLRYELAPPEVPELRLDATARLSSGQLSANLEADSRDSLGATGSLSFPLDFSLAPFRFSLPENGALAGAFSGEAQLSAIPQLLGVEEHVLSGELAANMDLAGTVRRPLVSGTGILEDGRYEYVESGTILENLSVSLRADGDTLYLDRLSATAGGEGRLDGQGHISLSPPRHFPVDATVAFTQATVVHRDDVVAQVDGDLRLAGTLQDLALTGTIDIGPAEVKIPERLPAEELAVIEVHDINAPPAEALETNEDPEDALEIRLDVRTASAGRILVTGPGLDSEWRGDAHITGTADAPRIAGTLYVTRGSLAFLGKRFALADSTVIFDADRPPSPYLNVIAVHDARDITARLHLTGEFSNLEVNMSSEPPLPEDEILAHVLFGKDMSEVSPVQALQLARYAAVFSGKVPGLRLLSGPPELPGIDRLDFRSGTTIADSAFGIGKHLSENVYVEFEQGIGPKSGRATVEVELTPEVSVEAKAGADRDNSVGIFWKKDY